MQIGYTKSLDKELNKELKAYNIKIVDDIESANIIYNCEIIKD